jgi:phosphatidylglycerophosphatase C
MKIAFFDFDGTITTDDSLLKFIRFVVGDFRFLQGLVVLLPVLTAYKLKLVPNYKAKQMMLSYFFKGMEKNYFHEVAQKYSLEHIDSIVRTKAMQKIQWHKNEGHKVVIVSASLECWLAPWCKKNDLELIGTKLDMSDGKVNGQLLSKNCYGIEKVNRIKEYYDLESFEYIYAYGDSSGDKEMLAIAHEQHYKPFR